MAERIAFTLDGKAVRVEWRGHKLGYVPRAQNAGPALPTIR